MGHTYEKEVLAYCPVCGEANKIRTTRDDGFSYVFGRACECTRRKEEEKAKMDRFYLAKDRQDRCFDSAEMKGWTFENQEGIPEKALHAAQNYVAEFERMLDSGSGLLLYGPVGTGKTYTAACICNEVIQNGRTARMTTLPMIIAEMQDQFSSRNEILQRLNRVDLLVLDDLGAERTSSYMQETMFTVIDQRLIGRRPLIVTTNMTLDMLTKPQDMFQRRMFDRILSVCYPVEVAGMSFRRKQTGTFFPEMKEALEI